MCFCCVLQWGAQHAKLDSVRVLVGHGSTFGGPDCVCLEQCVTRTSLWCSLGSYTYSIGTDISEFEWYQLFSFGAASSLCSSNLERCAKASLRLKNQRCISRAPPARGFRPMYYSLSVARENALGMKRDRVNNLVRISKAQHSLPFLSMRSKTQLAAQV